MEKNTECHYHSALVFAGIWSGINRIQTSREHRDQDGPDAAITSATLIAFTAVLAGPAQATGVAEEI